jgi:hypothetical protein
VHLLALDRSSFSSSASLLGFSAAVGSSELAGSGWMAAAPEPSRAAAAAGVLLVLAVLLTGEFPSTTLDAKSCIYYIT